VTGSLGIRVGKKSKSFFISYPEGGTRKRRVFGKFQAMSLKDGSSANEYP